MRVEKTKEQIRQDLYEQIGFLKKSSKDFDNGDTSEAKRVATSLRILLHDNPNSRNKRSQSLLLTIGDKENALFLNSASKFIPQNFMPYMGLVSMRVVSGVNDISGRYVPRLSTYPNVGGKEDWKPFQAWGDMMVIKDHQGNKFSRKDLVLHVAETDGGTHVDKSLDENYACLSRGNSMGFVTVSKRPGEVEKINYVKYIELSSIRQIAFEVLTSLGKYYGNFD